MNINASRIYSMISYNEQISNEDNQIALEIIENFKQIKTIEAAKCFIKKYWNVRDNTQSFYINNSLKVSLCDYNDNFSVNICFEDENITYYYNK